MNKTIVEILEHESPASFTSMGPDGPHMAATWNSYIQVLGDSDIVIPAGDLKKTEENIKAGSKLHMILASKDVKGSHGSGAGFLLKGSAYFRETGTEFERIKSRFPWVRAIMIFHIEEEKQLI